MPTTAADANAKIRFSVIVIHRNGADRLLGALVSIFSAIDPSQDEVIVVDNHSTDDSLDVTCEQFPQLTVIRNSCNSGYARACNQGIKAGRGEIFVLCNNDLVLPRDIFTHLASNFIEYPDAGLFAGQLLKPDGSLCRSGGNASGFLSELGFASRRRFDFSGDRPIQIGSAIGACLVARRSAILQAGSLDEDFFFYYEESEWCVRLQRHGWKIMLDPRIRIMHIGGASTRSFFYGSKIEFFRSRLLYWKKTLPPIARSCLILWHVPKLLLDSLFYLLAVALTCGLSRRLRYKLMDKAVVLLWLVVGRPSAWGLPDKCQKSGRN